MWLWHFFKCHSNQIILINLPSSIIVFTFNGSKLIEQDLRFLSFFHVDFAQFGPHFHSGHCVLWSVLVEQVINHQVCAPIWPIFALSLLNWVEQSISFKGNSQACNGKGISFKCNGFCGSCVCVLSFSCGEILIRCLLCGLFKLLTAAQALNLVQHDWK